MRLKSLVLLLETILHFLFDGLLPGDRLLFHSPLGLLKLALELFLFCNELLVVAIVIESLLMAELILHVVSEELEPLLILESQFLLQEVLLLSKLSPHSCLLLL